MRYYRKIIKKRERNKEKEQLLCGLYLKAQSNAITTSYFLRKMRLQSNRPTKQVVLKRIPYKYNHAIP